MQHLEAFVVGVGEQTEGKYMPVSSSNPRNLRTCDKTKQRELQKSLSITNSFVTSCPRRPAENAGHKIESTKTSKTVAFPANFRVTTIPG